MGFYPPRMECENCHEQWNAFFCSVDMSESGLRDCASCGSTKIKSIGDKWKYKGQPEPLNWSD